jgi:DNA-binding transcriptional LysR family regulator
MHIRSLKIFCDIVDLRSFSRAADANGMSQSSASQAVHLLEERLQVQLLDRSKRPFVLTPEGKCYYDGCRRMVTYYAELEEEVRTLHNQAARKLTVASIYSVGLAHMSAFMQQFSSEYPAAQVRLEYLHPARVYEEVERGTAQLGLVSYPRQTVTLEAIPWRSEPMVVVCYPNHPLVQPVTWSESNRADDQNVYQPPITLDRLAGESLVAFESGLEIREQIDQVLAKHHVKVKISLEFDNIETMKRAIELEEGIGILPEPTVAREIAMGSLSKVPLVACPLQRPLGIVHRRDRTLGVIEQQFVELLLADNEFKVPQLGQPPQLGRPPQIDRPSVPCQGASARAV